jgi:DNA-binding response OmpR family regulator
MTTTSPTETILLVEDDPPIRRLIQRVLQGQGYQLLEACNGREALSLAGLHRGTIDLLVTDVVMPKMDGFTLGERLIESRPDTRVLFLSGQAAQSMAVRGGLKAAGQAFLLKPFTHDCLVRAIRDQLDTDTAARPPAARDTVAGLATRDQTSSPSAA